MTYKFVLLIAGAYLLGSVPAAYIAAKLALGIDIREYGSGNVGGSNLLKVAPKWISAVAFTYDVIKGILPVWLARILGLNLASQVVVGLAAISGHNWSVFLGFSGGRGIATTLGVTLSLMPKLALILLGVVVGSIPFHQMPLVTLIALRLFPLAGWFSRIPWVGWLLGW
ncbi:MAG: glycerol-3-phosphate acyltransferase, partial [Chloroflexota bacterium]